MKKIWKNLSGIIESFSRLGATLAEICLFLLLMLVFHEVIARYVLNKPTLYSVEISEYLLIFVAFMAAGWVLQEDKHVRMPTVVNLMPPKMRYVAELITSVIVILFCSILVWQGAKASLMAFKGDYHSSSLLEVPLWMPYAIIPIGSLMLGLQMVVKIGKMIEKPLNTDNQ